MLKLICNENTNLKEFTENNYAQASFFWNSLLKNKNIKVNGQRVNRNIKLFIGDEVCYYLTKKQAEKSAFSIVYEDDSILVVDKESGVNAEAVYASLVRERGEECGFIHRLDRNTLGLMVFSLNEKAKEDLLDAFKARGVEKIYQAVCFGAPNKQKDILTAYLKKDKDKAFVQIFDKPCSGAEKIITEYSVLEQEADRAKLEIILHTGKTHQIRAHLAHIGCPIVGDMKYGNEDKNKELHSARQQLVAKSLAFQSLKYLQYLNGKRFYSKFELER